MSAPNDSAQQAIRRWGRVLRAEREQLIQQADANVRATLELLREASHVGFDLEEVADLLGVSAATLIGWRDGVAVQSDPAEGNTAP